MIINNTYETVTGSVTNMQTESFKIANNAHMMDILSKKLYTNPELAVCRELVCNAIDAHKAVNSPKKVEVTMPSVYNDFRFIVKDYGTGLSEEDVLNLYTTYGQSTKQGSNDFIGGLGIGSKSPFALTEEFSVVSRYRGTATTYHCYKQKGLPVCTKLSAVATDEHNGLTITVPFTIHNVSSFNFRAKKAFRGMSRELVEVHAEDPVEFYEDILKEVKHKQGRIYRMPEAYSDDCSVRMGQVLYKFPREWIAIEWSSVNVLLEFPVGSLTISASRETLEDNEENREAIVKVMQTEYLKWCKRTRDYLQNHDKVTFSTGLKIAEQESKFSHYTCIVKDDALHQTIADRRFDRVHSVDLSYSFYWDTRSNKVRARHDGYIDLTSKDVVAIIEDEPSVAHLTTMLKAWVKEKEFKPIYYTTSKTRYKAARFTHQCVYMSQLNKYFNMIIAQKKRRKKTATKMPKVKEDVTLQKMSSWGRVLQSQIRVVDEVPYVVLEKWQLNDEEAKNSIRTLWDLLDVETYGVNKTNVKHLSEEFVPLEEYIERHADDFDAAVRKSCRKRLLSYFQSMKHSYHSRYLEHDFDDMLKIRKVEYGGYRWGKDTLNFKSMTPSDDMIKDFCKRYEALQKALDNIEWIVYSVWITVPAEVKEIVHKLVRAEYDRLLGAPTEVSVDKAKGV